ncbi:MAG: SlyX family protein [Methylococcales bacterium]|nr:SlyX family protein [Methylococcales bacterium]
MREERIIELEIKLAYQEDLTQSLNDVIIQQQTQISRLENSLNLLHQNQQNLMEKIGL